MEDRLEGGGVVRLRVRIVKCISPGQFFVTMNHEDSEYLALDERMREFYSSHHASKLKRPRKWELDDPCAIKVDGIWKRGVVVEEPYVENVKKLWVVTVKLVDDVKSVSVPIDALMTLDLKFRRLGDRVTQCCLGGIQPVDGSSWTEASIQEFNDFVRRSYIYINQIRNDRVDNISVIYVELSSPINDPAGIVRSFTSDPESWISINHQLCVKGFAKEVRVSGQSDSCSGQVRNMMENEMVLLSQVFKLSNVKGFDADLLPQPPKESKSKWFPADPLEHDVQFGDATYVGKNCDIYIQNVSKDKLNSINDEVQRVCERSEPSNIAWELGDICLAKFDLDNKWYRGEIIGLNSHCGHHIVRFVDYGNVEYIKEENLRLAAGVTMSPLQVHVCYFDNLMPIAPPNWKELQIDLIHRLLVGKICRIELRKLRSGPLGIVRLFLPDDTNALERIVSEGLGQYINPPPGYLESNEAVWYDKDAKDTSTGSNPVLWRNCSDPESSYRIMEIPNRVNDCFVEIPAMLSPDCFFLRVISSTDDELMAQIEAFADLQATLQEEAGPLPHCTPTDKLNACICNYDGLWYRAAVVKSASNRLTVQYVDYGNVQHKSVEEVKPMKDSWYSIPAHAIPCRIYGYKYSGKFPAVDALQVLQRRFSSQSSNITATIKKRGLKNLEVELRDQFGALLYQDFIDTKIYVPR